MRDGTYKSTASSIDNDHKLHRCRKKTTTQVAGARRTVAGESGSASATQFSLTKFQEKADDTLMERFNAGAKMGISARKLAAGLWHLAAEFTSDGDVCGGIKRQSSSIHPVGFQVSCSVPVSNKVSVFFFSLFALSKPLFVSYFISYKSKAISYKPIHAARIFNKGVQIKIYKLLLSTENVVSTNFCNPFNYYTKYLTCVKTRINNY